MDNYAEFRTSGGDNILSALADQARLQLEAEARVARAEEELKAAQAALLHIREHVFPNLMDEASQISCTVAGGTKIELKEVLRASIPESGREEAHKWLVDHEAGAIIKREIKIEFGRDEEKWAKKFIADMAKRKRPLRAKIKESVHPQTLVAYLKQELEKGTDIPLKTFGASRQRFTHVTVPTK